MEVCYVVVGMFVVFGMDVIFSICVGMWWLFVVCLMILMMMIVLCYGFVFLDVLMCWVLVGR